MRLWAISDLHLDQQANRQALAELPVFGHDWLIVVGDLANRSAIGARAFGLLTERFARVIWVPGNHELWTLRGGDPADRLLGVERYLSWVAMARAHGVLTPEDPFAVWHGEGGPVVIAPLFLLYDYSFRPSGVAEEGVLDWAMEQDILPTDEALLRPDPHPTRRDWCVERCTQAEQRLTAIDADLPTVLANHWPLRHDLVHIPLIPRFAPWCGTTRSDDYHRRFRALSVVYGHLHVRGSHLRDGVTFEEVSLGYPRQWHRSRGMAGYLRQILPRR